MKDTLVAPQSRKIDGFDEWEVQSAADALQRAFEIRQKPKLFDAAVKMLKKKTDAAHSAILWSKKMR